MIVRHPAVWAALALLAIPILVHLLVRAPARIVHLPSLRFVPASRLQALRRHRLSDRGLLALRLLVLLCAVAAFADPAIVTACRTRAWDARLAQAVIVQAASDTQPPAPPVLPDMSTRIDVDDLNEGVRRAMTWLSTAPPARREIVVVSPFRLGALDPGVLRELPGDVGLRFVRVPLETSTGEVDGPVYARLDREGASSTATSVRADGETTEIEQAGSGTPTDAQVVERGDGFELLPWGIAIRGAEQDVARAALRSVLRAGIAMPAANEDRAEPRIVVEPGTAPADLQPATDAAMGPIVAALAADRDIAALARSSTPSMSQPRGIASRGQVLFRNGTGEPIVSVGVSAADPPALVVRLAAPPTSPLLPLVTARLARARVAPFDPAAIEVLTIPDGRLAAWSRAPGPVTGTRVHERVSDRRLFWTAVLVLLAAETFVRRRRAAVASSATAPDREDAA